MCSRPVLRVRGSVVRTGFRDPPPPLALRFRPMSDLPPPPGSPDAFPPPGGGTSGPGPADAGYAAPGAAGYAAPGGDQPGYGFEQRGYGYTYGPKLGAFAGFWRRFGAAFLDGIILAIPTNIVRGIAGDSGFSNGMFVGRGSSPSVTLLNTIIGVLYYALLEGGPRGQTIGKMALGIRVVDAEGGEPIGYARGVGRYFARWLSALPLLLGYFWMLWDERKQTWHDKLVRSVVVRTS